MRYLITFSYDGTKFHGFQRQNDVKNVQGTLENILSEVFGSNIFVKGSGRTDAGVHALGQCAHFDVERNITKEDIKLINQELNGEIVIKKYREVNNNFHARHSVLKKIYGYKIYLGRPKDNLKGYYYQINFELDFKKMKNACKILEGTHDYHNFVSGMRDDYVSTILKIKMSKKGRFLTLKFVGVGFYRYMVRHLVGAIIDVGRGKVELSFLQNMLDNPDKPCNLSVVPAEGLYLIKILY